MTAAFHPIKGKNRYCGPSAMATVLGVTTDHAARVIRGFSGERWIKGVSTQHLIAALEQLGVRVRYTRIDAAYESLAGWLESNLQVFQASHLILHFGVVGDSHYGTISRGMYQCNLSKVPVPFEAIPFNQSAGIVFGVFEVLDRPMVAPRDAKVVERGVLAKAKRIASRYGIVIESFDGAQFEVSCPELEHDDPLEGRNVTDDVRVVLALVEEYRNCLEGGYLEAVTDPCLMKGCPFCGNALTANVRGAGEAAPNPKASCKTEGCCGARLPVLCLDFPEDVAAFNRRAA